MSSSTLRTIAVLLCGLAGSASAELRLVGADPAQQPFRDAVYECLERFSAAPDAETREILEIVQRPAGTGMRHSIQQGALPPLVGGGTFGQPSVRSSSTIVIGTAIPLDAAHRLEFCSNLLHELKHAANYDQGEMDDAGPPPGEPGAGIRDADIDARREENRWRQHVGLHQLTEYGGIELPADAIFP